MRKLMRQHKGKGPKVPKFLPLPEHREKLYDDYFCQQCIHIVEHPGVLPNFRCKMIYDSPSECSKLWPPRPHQNDALPIDASFDKRDTAFLSISNPQVAEEAYNSLYQCVTFKAHSIAAWINFAAAVSPFHLAMIRTLYVYWPALPLPKMGLTFPGDPAYPDWEYQLVFGNGQFAQFWDLLATKMPGLQSLAFTMGHVASYLAFNESAAWLRPFTKVTGLRHFELDISLDLADDPYADECAISQKLKGLEQHLRERMCCVREPKSEQPVVPK